MPRVLVYTSSSDRIPHRKGGTTATGTWLPELTYPLAPLENARFAFTFATPDGRPCIIDPGVSALMHWRFSRVRRRAAFDFLDRLRQRGLASPMAVADVVDPVTQPRHELVDRSRGQVVVGVEGVAEVADPLVEDGGGGQVPDLVFGPASVGLVDATG